MSGVTSSQTTRIVFCEGHSESIDIRLYRRIFIANRLPDARYRIEIQPMGSKQAAKSFGQGYQAASRNPNWLIVRDRDLDAPPADNGELVHWGRIYLTGFTCLESYFLSPTLLYQFIQEYKIKFEGTEQDLQTSLNESIAQLSNYQAVRWSLQQVRRHLQQATEQTRTYQTETYFDLPNRLSKEDGKLPASLDAYACLKEAEAIITQFMQGVIVVTKQISLMAIFSEYQQQFQSEGFRHAVYRYWFHGKDVLRTWLRTIPNLSYAHYCQWAADHLEWHKFPDLAALQRIAQVESLI